MNLFVGKQNKVRQLLHNSEYPTFFLYCVTKKRRIIHQPLVFIIKKSLYNKKHKLKRLINFGLKYLKYYDQGKYNKIIPGPKRTRTVG